MRCPPPHVRRAGRRDDYVEQLRCRSRAGPTGCRRPVAGPSSTRRRRCGGGAQRECEQQSLGAYRARLQDVEAVGSLKVVNISLQLRGQPLAPVGLVTVVKQTMRAVQQGAQSPRSHRDAPFSTRRKSSNTGPKMDALAPHGRSRSQSWPHRCRRVQSVRRSRSLSFRRTRRANLLSARPAWQPRG